MKYTGITFFSFVQETLAYEKELCICDRILWIIKDNIEI